MSTDQLIELGKLAAAVAAIAGLIVLVGRAIRGTVRLARRLGWLADEVLGDEERPGWGKRIATIETRLTGVEDQVGAVVHEVRPNSGHSMRDEITRIAEATGANRSEDG